MVRTVSVSSEGDALRFRAIAGTADNDMYRIEVLPEFAVEDVGEGVTDEALDSAVESFDPVSHGDHNRIMFPKDAVDNVDEYAVDVVEHIIRTASEVVEEERGELDSRAFDDAMERRGF